MVSTESMLRELVENAHDLIFCLDPDGRFVYTNPAWRATLGYSEQELESRNLFDMIHEDSLVRCRRMVGLLLDGNTPEQLQQIVFVARDGKSVAVEGTCSVLVREGVAVLIRGIFRDITERRELEREILDISVAERQRIAHDLHDSLGQELVSGRLLASRLESRLIDVNPPGSESAAEIVGVLDGAIGTMREIVRGLYPFVLEGGDLPHALTEMAASVQRVHGIRCRFEAEGDSPCPDVETAMHLYYIAREAVNNAIKHANAGSIVVQLRREQGLAVLRITDDGVGISTPGPADGSGLHSMRYRANFIGAALGIRPAPEGGTVVTCAMR